MWCVGYGKVGNSMSGRCPAAPNACVASEGRYPPSHKGVPYATGVPVEIGVWRIDKGIVRVPSSRLDDEGRLEDAIEKSLIEAGHQEGEVVAGHAGPPAECGQRSTALRMALAWCSGTRGVDHTANCGHFPGHTTNPHAWADPPAARYLQPWDSA